uniref:1-acylglycerol-3-phosphate O-acyltransferase n=1 Tax=Syphacia muris TaxID=451379 RepID=A0A0N5ASR2_9BILA
MEMSLLFYIILVLSLAFNILWFLSASFRFRVRMTGYILCIFIAASVGGILSIPHGRTPKNHFRIFNIFHVISFWMHLTFELRDVKYIDSDKPFILVANHQSILDVLGMSYVWPENCVVLLKSSLKFAPGFNLCTFLCNSIFINRFSKSKAHQAVDNVIEAIERDKATNKILLQFRKIWIYPEGTRNAGEKLLPFKKGAFIIAKRANIPIVCVVFSSHRNFYDLKERRFDYGGHVIVQALPPIDSTKFDTVDDLLSKCQSEMQQTFHRLNKELGNEFAE